MEKFKFLNDMKMEELETLKSLIDSCIEAKKREERGELYDKSVSNILDEITVIIDDCFMGNKIAMTIREDDYPGVENDINMSWDDLLNYLEDSFISERGV